MATTQRDVMRRLAARHGYDKARTCAAYAAAEAAGDAPRRSRVMPADVYADALWRDGEKKGWLRA